MNWDIGHDLSINQTPKHTFTNTSFLPQSHTYSIKAILPNSGTLNELMGTNYIQSITQVNIKCICACVYILNAKRLLVLPIIFAIFLVGYYIFSTNYVSCHKFLKLEVKFLFSEMSQSKVGNRFCNASFRATFGSSKSVRKCQVGWHTLAMVWTWRRTPGVAGRPFYAPTHVQKHTFLKRRFLKDYPYYKIFVHNWRNRLFSENHS